MVIRCYIESCWFHMLRIVFFNQKLIDSVFVNFHGIRIEQWHIIVCRPKAVCLRQCASMYPRKENVQLILEFFKPNGCVWSLILEKHTKPYTLNLKKKQPLEKRDSFMETIIFQIPCQTFGGLHIWKFHTCLFPPKDFSMWTVSVSRILRSYWSLSSRGRIWYVRPRKFSYTLRIIGPSYRGVWICIAGFRDPSKCHRPDF